MLLERARSFDLRYPLTVLFAIAFTFLSLRADFISGKGEYWRNPAGDVAMSEIGWLYYARDDWRFPLFSTDNYHYPEGSSLILSDSLPVLAVPLKLFYKMFSSPRQLPLTFQGAWCALCFFLQVLAAARIIFLSGIKSTIPFICCLVLICYAPSFFFRFGHLMLMGHFLILYSVGDYIRATRNGPHSGHAVSWWIPLLGLLIHPYLAIMSGAIEFCVAAEALRRKALTSGGAIVLFAKFVAGAVAIFALGGGYLSAATTSYMDYGLYSLNLLSPIVPLPDTALGQFLKTSIPTPPELHQYEGASYLGLGVIVLALFVVPKILSEITGLIERHRILVVMIVASLLFAISNRVGFGNHLILDIPLSNSICALLSKLRGSGRFVWISLYFFLAILVIYANKFFSARYAALLLAACALLQLLDVAPQQARLRSASGVRRPIEINETAWNALVSRHSRIYEFPSFECGGIYDGSVPGGRWRALDIDWLAAKANLPNNSAYLTRDIKDCEAEKQLAWKDSDTPGSLYIYRSTTDVGDILRFRSGLERCGSLDDLVICSADMDLSSYR